MTDPFQALFTTTPAALSARYALGSYPTPLPSLRMFGARRLVSDRLGLAVAQAIPVLWDPKAWAGNAPPPLPDHVLAAFRAGPPSTRLVTSARPATPTKPTAAPSRPVTPTSAKPAQKAPPVKKKPPTHAEELASARALLARAERLAMTATDPEAAETLRACRENVMRLEMRAPSPEAAASLASMDRAFGLEKPRPMVQRANGRTTFSVHNVIRRS